MKAKISILRKLLLVILFLNVQFLLAQTLKNDISQKEYPWAQEEVKQTMKAIVQSVKEGNVEKLIAFHAYGPKFTEFKMGEKRVGSEENEAHERKIFGSVTEIVKFDVNDLKVAIFYDKVANVTFHSNFHLKFGDDSVIVNDQISLLFVKDNTGNWKIVHEHHSPLKNKAINH
ncbi:YybH family protein [Mangrovimonas spongiae]|uniref:SnoaL-like domain-containing protein n=1 Tax=Mangrovimonas spongiae TaxID=2494697 RepID=A0A3R9NN77_9FLAO|nr:nuclear transport factor 2 family protein [Mangrovimonas spongiae]RSK39782.1 hypothetical protein EJA19_07830 [Mangrovimonas spongiae]